MGRLKNVVNFFQKKKNQNYTKFVKHYCYISMSHYLTCPKSISLKMQAKTLSGNLEIWKLVPCATLFTNLLLIQRT